MVKVEKQETIKVVSLRKNRNYQRGVISTRFECRMYITRGTFCNFYLIFVNMCVGKLGHKTNFINQVLTIGCLGNFKALSLIELH